MAKRINSAAPTTDTHFKSGKLTITTRKRRFDKWGEYKGDSTSTFSINVLGLVFLVLILGALFAVFTSSTPKTFAGLLQFLQSVEPISLDWLDWSGFTMSLGDWGIFNFAREIFLFLVDIVNVLLFLCTGIVQAIGFLIPILQWLFL